MKKTNLLFMVLVAVSALPVVASLGGGSPAAGASSGTPLASAASADGVADGGVMIFELREVGRPLASAASAASVAGSGASALGDASGRQGSPKGELPKKSVLSALQKIARRLAGCARGKAHCAAFVAAPVAAAYLVCKAVPTALAAAGKIAEGTCPLEETNKENDVKISVKNGFTAIFHGRMINVPSTVLAAAGLCAYAGKTIGWNGMTLSAMPKIWKSAVKGLLTF
jgi:hypothetical protein